MFITSYFISNVFKAEKTDEQKIDKLLDIMKRRDDKHFNEFWEILRKEHAGLVTHCLGEGQCTAVDRQVETSARKRIQLSNSESPPDQGKKCKLEENLAISSEQVCDPAKMFKDMCHKLVKRIDAENGLLFYLLSKNILTYDEYCSINPDINYEAVNEQLIKYLLPKITQHYEDFLDALVNHSQKHVVLFIKHSGNMEAIIDRPNRPLTDCEMRKISNSKHCLVELMNSEDIRLGLLSKSCITDRHSNKINAQITNREKNDVLLQILVRRSYSDYDNFKFFLRKTMQSNIVDILEKGGVVAIHTKLKNRPDWNKIETTLIDRLTKYALGESNADNDRSLTEEQITTINDILKRFGEKKGIYIEIKGASQSGSIAIYAQFKNLRALLAMGKNNCDLQEIKAMLESIFACLLHEKDNSLIETVTIDQDQYIACLEEFYRQECPVHIRSKYDTIVECLSMSKAFISALQTRGVVSLTQIETLRKIKPYQDQNREFLSLIQRSDDINFGVIVDTIARYLSRSYSGLISGRLRHYLQLFSSS